MTVRLTWVQPEDLVGHELRQAAQDGRDTGDIEQRWYAAGGLPAPERAGASKNSVPRGLRTLAERLLDELAALESPLETDEPTGLSRIRAACPRWPAPRTHPAEIGPDRLHAAWLGRAAGCLLGKPVEKLPLAGIRALARATGNWPLTTWFTARGLPAELAAAHPWNRRSAPTSLAENIDGMPEDDDLDHPLLTVLLLQRYGRGFSTSDLARLWLGELPAGRVFTAERIAYRNLLDGIEPPDTARHRNPFREWIGARIRADVHGWTHPGDPGAAAEQAHRDAVLTHTANGVYGAMFTAAALAEAAGGGTDVHGCLAAGLRVVPPRSRYADAVRLGIRTARTERDFDTVVDLLHDAYGATHHWVHVLPNAALLAAALTHADGDFSRSIGCAVSGGWDTDSNGATAGSLAGLLAGHAAALPDRWTAPLKNRLATSVRGFGSIGFDTLAELTYQEVRRP
ncbi:MAG TPA: ADP-ribosylglycohydrolase family protein [Streptomyces sp.]|uniref:ADP-ribosylglycohydrolase family protein n=1 Tax=Streptomyces sp. TaxID=1931 RepID=UPI002CB086C7|nr:ADP-ribosylglycohydrolase family protein [Streptomyces sp.]HWU09853.1 ADP-ribosylglycohydrolase family protein [Streptomyces sp.]